MDPSSSTSRIADLRIVGQEHYTVARGVQQVLQRCKDLQDIIAILGIEELSIRNSAQHAALIRLWVAGRRSRPDSREQ